MDESDLISYKEQVATIETALQADPLNADLLTLKTELLELISLTESLLQQEAQNQTSSSSSFSIPITNYASSPSTTTTPTTTAAAARTTPSVSSTPSGGATSSPHQSALSPLSGSNSGYSSPTPASSATASSSATDPSKQPIYQPPPPTRNWAVGDRCRALYAADGKYYEATILSIGGSGQVFSVQYKGYESSPPALVGPQDMKPPHDNKKYQNVHHSAGASTSGEAGNEVEKGQKKRGAADGGAATSSSSSAAGAVAGGGVKKKKTVGGGEQVQKQMAWQNFSKAGSKKTKGTGTVLKKSIFATPDNPEGKVGVVGSGKGMTQFQQRGKHIYGQNSGPN